MEKPCNTTPDHWPQIDNMILCLRPLVEEGCAQEGHAIEDQFHLFVATAALERHDQPSLDASRLTKVTKPNSSPRYNDTKGHEKDYLRDGVPSRVEEEATGLHRLCDETIVFVVHHDDSDAPLAHITRAIRRSFDPVGAIGEDKGFLDLQRSRFMSSCLWCLILLLVCRLCVPYGYWIDVFLS